MRRKLAQVPSGGHVGRAWLKGGIFDTETSVSYISDTGLFPINHLINIYTEACSSIVKQPNHSETPTNFYLRFLVGLVGPGCGPCFVAAVVRNLSHHAQSRLCLARFAFSVRLGVVGPGHCCDGTTERAMSDATVIGERSKRDQKDHIVLIPINME